MPKQEVGEGEIKGFLKLLETVEVKLRMSLKLGLAIGIGVSIINKNSELEGR